MKASGLNILKRYWPLLIHPLALLPLLLLLWDFANNNLTANPIQAATQRTGLTALVLLLLSLSCTPLNTIFQWKRVLVLRRPLGLYAFGYAVIHLLIFAVVDYGLDLELIWPVISEKPYIIAGFSALLLLIPLAITSTKGWMRRLGKRWKLLHRLVYLAIALVILHFIWLSKSISVPLAYGAVAALLLVLRVPPVRKAIVQRTRLIFGGGTPAPAKAEIRAPD